MPILKQMRLVLLLLCGMLQGGIARSAPPLTTPTATEVDGTAQQGVSQSRLDSIRALALARQNLDLRLAAYDELKQGLDYEEIGAFACDIADIYNFSDRPDRAVEVLTEAQTLIPSEYAREHGYIDFCLAESYRLSNDLARCIAHFQSSREYFRSVDSLLVDQIVPLGELISLFADQGLYEQAFELNSEIIGLVRTQDEVDQMYDLAYDYRVRGSLLEKMGKDSVLYYLDMADSCMQIITDPVTRASYEAQTITTYLAMDRLDLIRAMLPEQPLDYVSGLPRPDVRDYYLVKVAEYYLRIGQAEHATDLFEVIQPPLALTPKINYWSTLQKYYFLLSDLESARIATDSLKVFRELAAEKHRENNLALARAEFENTKLQQKNEIEELKRKRQKLLTFALGSMVAILAIGFWYFWHAYRERDRINSQLSQTHGELIAKNQELETYIQSNIQLEQFAHIAAHDLKAPLRTIASFTGLLKKKMASKFTELEDTYVSYIERSTRSMADLIDDLLAYSKANSQSLEITRFKFRDVVDEAIRQLQHQVIELGAKIDVRNCEIEIHADRLKMRQVMQNLISNALKFHKDTDPPEVTIDAVELDGEVQICVSDNGIGVESDFQHDIFESFTTLHSRDDFDGSGIGLSICKEIISKHDGRIWVESISGLGSSFYFTVSKNLGVVSEETALL